MRAERVFFPRRVVTIGGYNSNANYMHKTQTIESLLAQVVNLERVQNSRKRLQCRMRLLAK